METSRPEPSGAAQAVIKAVLRGAFHPAIEAAGAALFALSKEQPHANTPTDVCTQEETAQEGQRSFSDTQKSPALIQALLFYLGFTVCGYERTSQTWEASHFFCFVRQAPVLYCSSELQTERQTFPRLIIHSFLRYSLCS